MMDLLERYLAEVRRNLPSGQADDIIAELRDVLLAQAEEQQDKTGQVDWNRLLQNFGHPLVVAARYRKQQWLIGPELYPFYLHFLKVIVTIVLAVITGLALFRGLLRGADVGQAIAEYLGSLWWGAASAIGSVTIVFALIERYGGSSVKQFRRWKPTELPDLNAREPSVYKSAFEVAVGVLFLLWWLGVLPTPKFGGEFTLVAAPVWQTIFWPVAALLASQLVFNLARWLRPRWKLLRAVLGTVNALTALALAAILYRADRLITVVPEGADPARVAGVQNSLDLACHIAVVVVVIVWVLNFGAELWRMAQSGLTRPARGPLGSTRT